MNAPPRLLVTRRMTDAVHDHLRAHFDAELNELDRPMGQEELVAAMRRYDAILLAIGQRFDATTIRAPGRSVRIVANFGAGTDHIDLDAAKAEGLIITNTPDAVTEATADLAMMLILMAARRGGEAERLVRAGRWKGWGPTEMLGQGLGGKTLGLLGFGRIAQAVAQRALGFGMKIVYHSRSGAPAETETRFRASRAASLEALAELADVLSLHVPGGEASRHLIDAALLARMKPSAILVNSARGSVVDEPALARALREGQIAAAGLDVFEAEPKVHPELLDLENVVLIPHLGSATIEARTAMGMQAAANLQAYFAGEAPPNRVA